MPIELTNSIPINDAITETILTSFTIDTVRNEMIIAYDDLDAQGKVVRSGFETASGQDFVDAMTSASQKAASNPNVAEAVKVSVYESLLKLRGLSGEIT